MFNLLKYCQSSLKRKRLRIIAPPKPPLRYAHNTRCARELHFSPINMTTAISFISEPPKFRFSASVYFVDWKK
jgi:hypothetical protein